MFKVDFGSILADADSVHVPAAAAATLLYYIAVDMFCSIAAAAARNQGDA